MNKVLTTVLICILSTSLFAGGAYWGSYQFGKIFSELNTQSYMEKTFVHQILMIGALRELDSGNVNYARSQLKGYEDQLIITVNLYRDFIEEDHFPFMCARIQDIANYRKANKSKYDERPSPIDADINAILTEWETVECNPISG